jgi:hypothetical protein
MAVAPGISADALLFALDERGPDDALKARRPAAGRRNDKGHGNLGEEGFRMAQAVSNPKRQAHELIDRLSTAQASAVVTLITSMLDPVDRAIANAPLEDEEISEEESRAVAASKAWLAEHPGEGIPHEEILRELGLSPEDLRS